MTEQRAEKRAVGNTKYRVELVFPSGGKTIFFAYAASLGEALRLVSADEDLRGAERVEITVSDV